MNTDEDEIISALLLSAHAIFQFQLKMWMWLSSPSTCYQTQAPKPVESEGKKVINNWLRAKYNIFACSYRFFTRYNNKINHYYRHIIFCGVSNECPWKLSKNDSLSLYWLDICLWFPFKNYLNRFSFEF